MAATPNHRYLRYWLFLRPETNLIVSRRKSKRVVTTIMGTQPKLAASSSAAKFSTAEPDLEIRLNPLYAWMLIIFGGIFFLLGLMMAAPIGKTRNVGLGLLISFASAVAIVGGNYWRQHLPIMVRMTPRELILSRSWPRSTVIAWANLAELDKKSINLTRHGVRHSSELVFIKLKSPLPTADPLSASSSAYKRFNEMLLTGIKNNLLGGYDLWINPQDEFSRSADWFIGECRKRMNVASQ